MSILIKYYNTSAGEVASVTAPTLAKALDIVFVLFVAADPENITTNIKFLRDELKKANCPKAGITNSNLGYSMDLIKLEQN